MMIVKDTAGTLYMVTDAGPGLDHVYLGTPAKRGANGWEAKAKASAAERI